MLKYAQQYQLQIDDLIKVEISSRRHLKERRIDDMLSMRGDQDVLLVAEQSRLGRNMFEVINIINKEVVIRKEFLILTGSKLKNISN